MGWDSNSRLLSTQANANNSTVVFGLFLAGIPVILVESFHGLPFREMLVVHWSRPWLFPLVFFLYFSSLQHSQYLGYSIDCFRQNFFKLIHNYHIAPHSALFNSSSWESDKIFLNIPRVRHLMLEVKWQKMGNGVIIISYMQFCYLWVWHYLFSRSVISFYFRSLLHDSFGGELSELLIHIFYLSINSFLEELNYTSYLPKLYFFLQLFPYVFSFLPSYTPCVSMCLQEI